ncbi:hypothetical protein AMTR_s00013p00191450 [Amborella trichopoda]|uniref:Cytochrome P450 n=2 Tax=Amborella trichopoda TaxID=13333 RepID=W1PQ57_AMBTC|nr:hypothetical protein AMTR_s00013p00191450 [Amborella trichopoda]
MARLVLHPAIQARAQAELDRVVGLTRHVADADLPNLPYLLSILKETLRLHPPGPLLSWARLSIQDVHVSKSYIPKGTTAMVNMWAIAHDPNIWPDPLVFDPERFDREPISIMGSDLRLAPFGSGRRVCPGKSMGLATCHLWLARLLHHYQWLPHVTSNKREKGLIDLRERLKLSMEMKRPLVCKAMIRNRVPFG